LNVQEPAERTIGNIERVIVGKHAEVRLALVALLCEGHILIEDVPGVGKTMLAKALSRSVGCAFRRIQFTPDLLPSDVTGLSIFNQKTQDFEFRPGPIMAQVVLADEINRATPKTQSALLECMEERQATIDGVSRLPSGLVMTVGSPPSMTATTELVVPRSIPMILEAMSTPNEFLRMPNRPPAQGWTGTRASGIPP